MKYLFLLFSITIPLILNTQTNKVQLLAVPISPNVEKHKNAIYSYLIIPSVNNTWGYDIFLQKRLFIHQPSIPGLPGNEGFKTKTSAKKLARVVIGKIKKGEMPPSVTIEEMRKMKILCDK
jgi:hypothetical protein